MVGNGSMSKAQQKRSRFRKSPSSESTGSDDSGGIVAIPLPQKQPRRPQVATKRSLSPLALCGRRWSPVKSSNGNVVLRKKKRLEDVGTSAESGSVQGNETDDETARTSPVDFLEILPDVIRPRLWSKPTSANRSEKVVSKEQTATLPPPTPMKRGCYTVSVCSDRSDKREDEGQSAEATTLTQKISRDITPREPDAPKYTYQAPIATVRRTSDLVYSTNKSDCIGRTRIEVRSSSRERPNLPGDRSAFASCSKDPSPQPISRCAAEVRASLEESSDLGDDEIPLKSACFLAKPMFRRVAEVNKPSKENPSLRDEISAVSAEDSLPKPISRCVSGARVSSKETPDQRNETSIISLKDPASKPASRRTAEERVSSKEGPNLRDSEIPNVSSRSITRRPTVPGPKKPPPKPVSRRAALSKEKTKQKNTNGVIWRVIHNFQPTAPPPPPRPLPAPPVDNDLLESGLLAQEEVERSEYEVEKILTKSIIQGKPYYQIKWLGYDSLTWEPAENLMNALQAIREFERLHDSKSTKVSEALAIIKGKESVVQPQTVETEREKVLGPTQERLASGSGSVSGSKAYDSIAPDVHENGSQETSKQNPQRGAAMVTSSRSNLQAAQANPSGTLKGVTEHIEARNSTQSIASSVCAAPQVPVENGVTRREQFIPIPAKDGSGVENGFLVVNILAHKPKNLVIRLLDDIDFLVNYADHRPEFVSYEVCIQHIAHQVAEYLARNPVLFHFGFG